MTEIIILMCIKLTRERSIPRISTPRLNRTIESISVIEISDSFRFRIIELFKSSRCPKIFEKIIQEKSFFWAPRGESKKICANTLMMSGCGVRDIPKKVAFVRSVFKYVQD